MSHDPVRCPSKALVMDRDNAHRGYWLAMIPDGHNAEDVLRPEYFGFHAGRIRVGDVIEVQSEDMSWWGELLVRAIPAGLNMIVTRKRFLDHFEVDDLPAGYEIKYLGHTGKHTVFYQGNAIQGDFSTREEAAIKVFQSQATSNSAPRKLPQSIASLLSPCAANLADSLSRPKAPPSKWLNSHGLEGRCHQRCAQPSGRA